jgi:hypothetical protein
MRIMPRIALAWLCLVGACSFDADYNGATLLCSDDKCPSGLECRSELTPPVCRPPRQDGGMDMPDDVMPDAMPHALNCADPGPIGANGGMASDTTANRTNKVMPLCNGSMMLAADAVYEIEPGSGRQMLVSIETTASYSVVAYVTSQCPSTACLTNMYATPGNPISITTVAGPQYIVVDSTLSAMSGPYKLTITFP